MNQKKDFADYINPNVCGIAAFSITLTLAILNFIFKLNLSFWIIISPILFFILLASIVIFYYSRKIKKIRKEINILIDELKRMKRNG